MVTAEDTGTAATREGDHHAGGKQRGLGWHPFQANPVDQIGCERLTPYQSNSRTRSPDRDKSLPANRLPRPRRREIRDLAYPE